MLEVSNLIVNRYLQLILISFAMALGIGCHDPRNLEAPEVPSPGNVESCISHYHDSVVEFVEYHEVLEAFSCFYQNAYAAKRGFYNRPLDSITIDDFVLFSHDRDTALLMYWERVLDAFGGYYFQETSVFAYKNELGSWKFSDQCNASIYPSVRYSLEIAKRNVRLRHGAEYFLDKDCRLNFEFLGELCENYCGPCRDHYLGDDTNSVAYRAHHPPDSLYGCD